LPSSSKAIQFTTVSLGVRIRLTVLICNISTRSIDNVENSIQEIWSGVVGKYSWNVQRILALSPHLRTLYLIYVKFQATTCKIYVRKSGNGTRLIPCQYHYHSAPYSYFIHRHSIFSPHPMVQQPLVGEALLIREASRSHSDTHTHTHSVAVFWTSGQADEETSTWQHTTITRDRHPCPGGFRTPNPIKRAAAGPRLRPSPTIDAT
jgi:hypothetical protein